MHLTLEFGCAHTAGSFFCFVFQLFCFLLDFQWIIVARDCVTGSREDVGPFFLTRFCEFGLIIWSIDFRGGLELLFGSQKKHEVDVVPPNGLKEVLQSDCSFSFNENLALKNQPLQCLNLT